MARKVTKKRKLTYEERLKAGKEFYLFLFKLFLSAAIICTAGLAYLWFWLARYEAQSPQGAIRTYLANVAEHKWDKVYQEDIDNFLELNTKDSITAYLMELYEGKNHWGMSFAYSYTDGDIEHYKVYYEKNQISELELKKPNNSKTWKVRTVNKNGTYQFDTMNNEVFSINGIRIDNQFPSENKTCPKAYEELNLDEKLPDVREYTIGSFIWAPEPDLNDSNDIWVLDRATNTFYIGPKPTNEEKTEFETEIQDTAVAYCKYITNDGKFYTLNQHLYPNTTFYNNIVGFDPQWFSKHNSIEFKNMKVYDVIALGENAFIGSISFDYVVSSDTVTKTYSSSYQLTFVKNSRGLWKMTDLYILNDSGTQEEAQ